MTLFESIKTMTVEELARKIAAIATECTDCLGCVEDNYHFTLYSHHYRTDSFSIALGLVRKINDIIIAPTSETLSINYCPWCGRKLHNKDDVEFNKCCVQRLKHIER